MRKALWETKVSGENAELELKAAREKRDAGCSKAVLFCMVHLSLASLISLGEKLQCMGSCLDCSTSPTNLVDSGSQVNTELMAMKGKDNSLASKWSDFFPPSDSFPLSNGIQIPMWKCSFYFCPPHEVFALTEISVSL